MISFNQDDWDKIKDIYKKWWNNEQNAPILPITLQKNQIGLKKPAAPVLSQKNCADFSWSADELIEAMDYSLSCNEYLGGAFPHAFFDFGPGVVAAFCGAQLDNSTGNVWFHRQNNLPIEDVHVEYNPKSKWALRIKDIYHAGNKKWNGNVIMAMPDLGGILDIAATFCDTDNLLTYLYDEPREVKRLCAEIQTAWFAAYNDFMEVLGENAQGYTDWSHVYSDKPSYISQCDFSYMISPEMFREFVLGDLNYCFQKLDNNIYHLDGIGQLPHLDFLTDIRELNAIQWVPGDGSPPATHWIDVYNKIKSKNKSVYIYGNYSDFLEIAKAVGRENIFMTLEAQDKSQAIRILEEQEII